MRSRHQEIKATRCRRPRPTRSSTYSEREREREGGRGARHHARFYFICDAPGTVGRGTPRRRAGLGGTPPTCHNRVSQTVRD